MPNLEDHFHILKVLLQSTYSAECIFIDNIMLAYVIWALISCSTTSNLYSHLIIAFSILQLKNRSHSNLTSL